MPLEKKNKYDVGIEMKQMIPQYLVKKDKIENLLHIFYNEDNRNFPSYCGKLESDCYDKPDIRVENREDVKIKIRTFLKGGQLSCITCIHNFDKDLFEEVFGNSSSKS